MATFASILDACDGAYLHALLPHLTVKEACAVAAVSRAFRSASAHEVRRRSDAWIVSTSRAWAWSQESAEPWARFGRVDVSADEASLDDEHALNRLGLSWRGLGTPRGLLEQLAVYCGGWPRLLHAREVGAAPPPRFRRGQPIEFTTLGENEHRGDERALPCPVALIFDIYCDERHTWCGVYPLGHRDVGCSVVEDDQGNDISLSYALPFSSNALGDSTTPATIHSTLDDDVLTHYFLSMDKDDTRIWSFNVSIVTPKSFETLILKGWVDPSSIPMNEAYWETDAGYDEFRRQWRAWEEQARRGDYDHTRGEGNNYIPHIRKIYDSKVRDANLWRFPRNSPPYETISFCAETGIDKNGNTRGFSELEFETCFWLEKRSHEKDRLHLTLALSCEDSVWSDMVLNTRKQTTTSSQEKPAKRRRTG